MKSLIGTFELQIDEKSSGGIIRLNDSRGKCILRICRIKKDKFKLIDMSEMPFVDITLTSPPIITII